MPDIFKEHIPVSQLGVTPYDIIGYISPGDIANKEYFTDIARTELEKIKDEYVLAGYVIAPAALEPPFLTIGNTTFSVGSDVSLMLRSVEKTIVFACTVSRELNEKLEQQSFNENYLDAYLMDIIGTVVIGKAVERIHEKIKKEFSSHKVTNTISPGNCGWPVEEQKKLIGLLPGGFLNITLNDSGMMHPVKSLTGIIGTGPDVKFMQTECRYCRSRNCTYRKEEYAGT